VNTKRKILVSFGGVLFVAVFVALALPLVTAKTNCGGNSYALSACATFAVAAYVTAQDNHSQFEVGKIGKDEWQSFLTLAGNHWGMNRADFLVKTNFVLGNGSNRDVIIVSKREFGNVPQPTIRNFYHRNPAHAVGYSDGTTGLISPEQFANLNLTGFVSLSNLVTNFESNVSKP
jgi:hypothetical protein